METTPEHYLQLQDAPCHVALFDVHGALLFATKKIRAVFPEVNSGLREALQGFVLECGVEEVLQRLTREGKVKFLGRRKDERIWQLTLSHDEADQPVSLQAEDISAQYEEVLRQRFLLELAEKTPDGLGVMREDLSGLWANHSLQSLLALRSPRQTGRRLLERADSENGREALMNAFQQAREQGHFIGDAALQAGRDKAVLDINQIIAAHRDPLTGREYFSTIIRDISTIKDTQRSLDKARHELEHRLEVKDLDLSRERQAADYSRDVWRSLVEKNRDLVLFTDAEANILFANRGFLPSASDQLIGTRIASMIAPPDRMAVLEAYRKLIEEQTEHVNIEARVVCLDSQLRYCVILINRLERLDGQHTATWVISDATESRQTRERMLAQEKMAATGRMAARIAHEINNPLAAIKSSLELVRLDMADSDPAHEYMQLMNRELRRLSNIIRQMYGLYRPEQDRPRVLEINEIITDCLTLMGSSARQRNLKLERDGPETVRVLASEAGVRQILFNIIQNALDVAPDGSAVLVEVTPCTDSVQVRVKDQGPGLDEQQIDQLFEPFHTSAEGYSDSGLGLGLSVSASLAKSMGADLQLHNRAEGGACATLSLPAAGDDNQ